MQKHEIFVIPIATPLLVGIYSNGKLEKTITQDGKTSDVLPEIFNNILKEYDNIGAIYYVNGPGSYMAIKVSYIFLKTISIVHKIPLLASNGFAFNNNSPIKALGKKYFFNSLDDTITIDFLQKDTTIEEFQLPRQLDRELFSKNNLPNYNLPAV